MKNVVDVLRQLVTDLNTPRSELQLRKSLQEATQLLAQFDADIRDLKGTLREGNTHYWLWINEVKKRQKMESILASFAELLKGEDS